MKSQFLHALNDCPEVEGVWKFFIPRGHWIQFFSKNLIYWVKINLKGYWLYGGGE